MTLLAGRGVVWAEVEKLLRPQRRGRAHLAIAYVGTGARRFLHPRAGDILVVDMSDGAVAGGATNPHELTRLRARGVALHNRHGLHAKVIVADHWTAVGSANASTASYGGYDEAAVLLRDPATVREARAFVSRIAVQPITDEALARAKRIYRAPTAPRRKDLSNPITSLEPPTDRGLFIGAFLAHFDRSDLAEAKRGRASLEPGVPRGFRIETWCDGRPARRYPIKVGDLVIGCTGRVRPEWVYPPGVVIGVERFMVRGQRRVMVYSQVRGRFRARRWREFEVAAGHANVRLKQEDLRDWKKVSPGKGQAALCAMWSG